MKPPPTYDLKSVRAELRAGRRVEVHASLATIVFFMVLAVAMLGIGGFMLHASASSETRYDRLWTLAMGAFIGLAGLYFLADYTRRLVFSRLSLVLDPAGVHDHTHGRMPIVVPWQDVEKVYVGVYEREGVEAQRFVSIEVRDSEALRRRVGLRRYGLLAVQKGQTGALVNISESLLPEAAEHWVDLIQALADESQAATATPPDWDY